MPQDPIQEKIGRTITFMSQTILKYIIIPAMEGKEGKHAGELTDMTMDFLQKDLSVNDPLEIMFITGTAMSVIRSLAKQREFVAETN